MARLERQWRVASNTAVTVLARRSLLATLSLVLLLLASPPIAFGWFRKAAAQGHAQAQDNLGVLYLNGWGNDGRSGTGASLAGTGGRAGRGHSEYQA